MSRVILAKSAGFCFGVSRSVKIAEEQLESGSCKCLGPLIHNEDVVARLEDMGLAVIYSPDEANAGERVIIRSHGASRAVIEGLRSGGVEVVDATCPFVARIHKIVSAASETGRRVVVIGTAGHAEVEAICGWCSGAVVVSDAQELEKWLLEDEKRCGEPSQRSYRPLRRKKTSRNANFY